MTEQTTTTIAWRVRAAESRPRKYEIGDDVSTGLGLAVQPTRVRTFVLNRMVRGRRRYATVGSADAMIVPETRREACRLIASYIEPLTKDEGPRTPGRPMIAFADEFLQRYARHWKPATQANSAYIVRKHILPAFGHLTMDAISVEHVRDWFASLAATPGSANRSMLVLSTMMRMAEVWGYRPHNSNPCKNTRRYRTAPKERFLTADEMARLTAVLTRDEFYCPHIVATPRLLMLTGCRLSEVLSLEWDWIKGQRIHLPDSKSGPRTVCLSSAARAVIEAIPLYGPECPFLFPARPPTRYIDNIEYQWPASAPRMWPRGSTRRARIGLARPSASSRYCAR